MVSPNQEELPVGCVVTLVIVGLVLFFVWGLCGGTL